MSRLRSLSDHRKCLQVLMVASPSPLPFTPLAVLFFRLYLWRLGSRSLICFFMIASSACLYSMLGLYVALCFPSH